MYIETFEVHGLNKRTGEWIFLGRKTVKGADEKKRFLDLVEERFEIEGNTAIRTNSDVIKLNDFSAIRVSH